MMLWCESQVFRSYTAELERNENCLGPARFQAGQVTPAPAADGIARGASQTGVELLLACFFMFIIVAGGAVRWRIA